MPSKRLLNQEEISRILDRLASEVVERHALCKDIVLVGIERRGADLARRLQGLLEARTGAKCALGTLDINLYRDDWTSLTSSPSVGTSRMQVHIPGAPVLLVDDVLYTGRTVRSALEAIMDYGRPARVELLVLVDRGCRELPIQADYVGRTIATTPEDRVDVLLTERDGRDEVNLVTP